jgi:hypothetical protein
MSSNESEIRGSVRAAGGRGGATARERSRRRKTIYVVAIIALMFGLLELSRPATRRTKNEKTKPGVAQTVTDHPGGVLAQYREKNGLSQTELGEIDPTSETVRLATLGMRGVGSSLLWLTATQEQMKKDWTQLRATLIEISKLQPHSIAVWRYQAWNLSYNVSVSFDDYHDKFYWVIEGLNFMLDGIDHNDKEPRLYWDMAWFISNKIGRADEAKYYRRLFAGKKDVSATPPSITAASSAANETPRAKTRPIMSRTSANASPRPAVFRPAATCATIGTWARPGSWPRRARSIRLAIRSAAWPR